MRIRQRHVRRMAAKTLASGLPVVQWIDDDLRITLGNGNRWYFVELTPGEQQALRTILDRPHSASSAPLREISSPANGKETTR